MKLHLQALVTVLSWMGFSMLRGTTAKPGDNSSLTPLILLVVIGVSGPGPCRVQS